MAAPPLVYSVENSGASSNYPAPPLPTLLTSPVIQPLPDPFCWANDPTNKNGTRGTNFVDWEHHRSEIAAQIQNYEIGTKPVVNPTNIFASYSAGTLTVRVTNNNQVLTLTCPVSLPSGSGPFPVCIGMDGPYGSLPSSAFTSRNIAGISYFESQVTTYNNPQNTDPFFKLYGPAQNTSNTGQYAAWAWGVSRVIDALYKLNGMLGTTQIDLNHIAVTGCSYAGKLALFSGAFDERIALTIAQESGGGGANSWRYNHIETPGTVECIDNTSYQWFSSSRLQQFAGNNVSRLPEDHHELDALVAPRALYVTGNTGYTWLGNPSCYVCSTAVQQIYNTLGIADRFGYNVDGGHNHCTFPSDQTNDLSYFLDKFMVGNTNLSSVIGTYPAGYPGIINAGRWTAWWGTKSAVFPYNGVLTFTAPSYATEGDGTLVGAGRVGVTPIPTNDPVLVNLTSANTNKVVVPASVTIPVGQSNAVFDLTIIDNAVLDGDQSSLITANSPVCNNGNQYRLVVVHDNESATLSASLPASASESAGTLANAGTVSMSAVAAADITVSLSSSPGSMLSVPSTTVIPQGQTSAVFNVTCVDNHIFGGSSNVTVTAHVQNWTDGSASMTILFDDPLPSIMHFLWSAVPSPQLIGEPFPVAITAQDSANNPLDYRFPANLSALIPDNTTGTNTILNSPSPEQSLTDGQEYVFGYSFTPATNLKVTHVRHYFGDKVSIWTAGGQLLASQNVISVAGTWVDTPLPTPLVLPVGPTYLIMVHANGVQYFWSTDLPATFSDGTINQSWWDNGDVFPTQTGGAQWYFVDLRYATNFLSIPVNPVATANFSSGSWSGKVAVLQGATNVILQASAGTGRTGFSFPFNVLGTPKLAITNLGNSVILSWPAAASGFNLEYASTLGIWSNCPAIQVIVGDRYTATNNIGTNANYFRLRKP